MTDATSTNPTTPYGPLIETRIRVVTWNLWWRLGDWKARANAITETLTELQPDLIFLQEVWEEGDVNQAALLADQLGMSHAFAHDQVEGGVNQGVAMLCRWPLQEVESRPLPIPPGIEHPNVTLRALVDGPRGPLLAVTTHLTPYRKGAFARRLTGGSSSASLYRCADIPQLRSSSQQDPAAISPIPFPSLTASSQSPPGYA